MTKQQAESLQAGDKIYVKPDDETIMLEENPEVFSLGGLWFVHIKHVTKSGEEINLPYYLDEIELVATEDNLCKCDIMVLMRVGCQCKGI